jgi:pimeloyl-ACP methyl ester carboxylesterase
MGHAVTAIDLRGHGLSDKPNTGYDMSTIADDICDVLLSVNGYNNPQNKPILLGQSWGGNIVVECAQRCCEVLSPSTAEQLNSHTHSPTGTNAREHSARRR